MLQGVRGGGVLTSGERQGPLRCGMEDDSTDVHEPADSHSQEAGGKRRLRPCLKIVFWTSLLGQMNGVVGLTSPERRDPTYHASHYLCPCKTVADCGARQLCLSGQCTCPFILGLTGAPVCTTMSKVSKLSLIILLCSLLKGMLKPHLRHVNVNEFTRRRVLGSSCAGRY